MPQGVMLGRENTLGKVAHPEYLKGPDSTRVLIDDPLVAPIQKGDLVLGWEGDERYALYVNHARGAWELWRREADDVYRMSVAVPGFVKGSDIVPWLVVWILEHDGRRGFNPAEHAIAEQVAAERARAKVVDAFQEEAADRLHHGLMKDLGDTEVGMSRRQFGGYLLRDSTTSTIPAAAGEQE